MADEFVIRIRADDAATATIKKIQAALGKVTSPVEKAQNQVSKLGDVGKAGLQKVQKGLSGVSNAARSVVDRIVEIVPGLTAIGGAASIAGLAALAERFGSFGFGLNKSSKLLDMNAQDLAAWHVAAKRAGVSAEEFDQSMVSSQDAIRGAANGANPEAMMVLQKMGVQISRNKDGTVDYLHTQQDVLKALRAQHSVEGQRAAAGALGMSSLLPMIQQGTYEADKARAMRKGLVPSDAEIAKAKGFREDINDLQDSVSGLGNSIGSALIPVLDPLVKGFAQWLDGHRAEIADKISDAVQRFSTWISSINWDEVTSKAKGFWDSIGGIKGVAIAIAAITFAGPIGGVLSLITNLTKLSSIIIPTALGQLALLAGAAYAAETARQRALDDSIHQQPGESAADRDQRVAEAQAGGAVSPDGSGPNQDLGGRFYRWVSGMLGGRSNQASTNDVIGQLQAQGWSHDAASGVAANLFQESGFNPAISGDNGSAYGIAQWHADRQAEFQKWSGHNIRGSSLNEQLKFLTYEMRNGKFKSAGDRLDSASSAEEAGRVVSQYYEIPRDAAGEADRRGALAATLGQQFPGTAPAGATTAADDAGHAANVQALQQQPVHITVNAPPGTRVEAHTADGGYLPTRVNYALDGNMGAMP